MNISEGREWKQYRRDANRDHHAAENSGVVTDSGQAQE